MSINYNYIFDIFALQNTGSKIVRDKYLMIVIFFNVLKGFLKYYGPLDGKGGKGYF